ncbi:MAG TPA: flavodoxin-dependent (E)-4-hydroxy-3-methylbut-2-enyl-diphosphate synthase, partial [Emticicia sp.]
MGIGTLLEDGLGDTVRVSLTEDPEFEAPVAKALVDRYTYRKEKTTFIPTITYHPINPYQYQRRETIEVENFGGLNVPRVIADFSEISVEKHEDLKPIGHFYLPLPDKWRMNDIGADYIYSGKKPIPFMLPNGLKEILDAEVWALHEDTANKIPLFDANAFVEASSQNHLHKSINFVKITIDDLKAGFIETVRQNTSIVLIVETNNEAAMPELRKLYFDLINAGIKNPVVIKRNYKSISEIDGQLYAATDCGGLLVDGFGDGIMLTFENPAIANSTSFGILQAARTRMSKTEYISCPSCGRTLFDLQETTALIRKNTDHLKGVKIGIMGCIVNGPGEMADADYGYVGIGKDKIALYRGQNVVKKSVHADNAVNELIELIKEDGRWLEPEVLEMELMNE